MCCLLPPFFLHYYAKLHQAGQIKRLTSCYKQKATFLWLFNEIVMIYGNSKQSFIKTTSLSETMRSFILNSPPVSCPRRTPIPSGYQCHPIGQHSTEGGMDSCTEPIRERLCGAVDFCALQSALGTYKWNCKKLYCHRSEKPLSFQLKSHFLFRWSVWQRPVGVDSHHRKVYS